MALRVLAPAGFRSPTVTAVLVPPGVDPGAIVKGMAARGWVIGGGYGKVKSTTFRIGHMGDHTEEELESVLGELDAVLRTPSPC